MQLKILRHPYFFTSDAVHISLGRLLPPFDGVTVALIEMDNFKWQKGFSMTFGLIAVDRATQERHPKESLAFLGGYAPRH